ncbi:MAG TPA: nucleoside kinase [Anaerolineaceae bacterium]|nr:nucleoside kinase [Anaerolineaceae bacterium]
MNDSSDSQITFIQPRDEVEVHLPDGRVLQGKRNTPVGEFLKALPEWDNPLIVGAIVNHELRELTYPISIESKVVPLTMASADGARIYRRSLTFLLEAAFEELFPGAVLAVDHSVTSGGYYCQVGGRQPLTEAELQRLETRMRELVEQDLPFERLNVPLKEAIQYFESKGHVDKVSLLKYRNRDRLVLYQLGSHRDYHHGYMVPSTGYLRWFGLKAMDEGFILQYPRRHAPRELLPLPDFSILLKTFKQYGAWLAHLGIDNVGALNDAISADRIREIILVSEALHEQKIAEIAREIVRRADQTRIILIAGPSSSGKTTFSKRLSVQLLAYGLSPFALEMDNYFVDREFTPRDENGDYDFEALEALDIRRLENDLRRLIQGEEVQLPRFDFREGKSHPGDVVRLEKDQLVILEGIHGLNPRLLPNVPAWQTFRIYASCLTQLNLDRHNRISTTDTRLLRRIVRDARERGYSALETIGRWESVRRGEKNYIFPYQENADEIFNSALVYELSALKPLAEPLLRQVPYGTPEYIEAKRLLAFIEWFLPLDMDLIPDNSILREFIGGSILRDFKIWRRPI